jgi:hypothetical protein
MTGRPDDEHQALDLEDSDDLLEDLRVQQLNLHEPVLQGIQTEILGGSSTIDTSPLERLSFRQASEINFSSLYSTRDPEAALASGIRLATDVYNRVPQARLDMLSPHDLVYGRGLQVKDAIREQTAVLQRGEPHALSDGFHVGVTGDLSSDLRKRAASHDFQVDEGVLRHGGPFPVFLSDLSTMRGIRRADEFHSVRHGQPAISASISEQKYRRIAGESDLPWENAAGGSHHEFHSSLGLSGQEGSSSVTDLGDHGILFRLLDFQDNQ